MSMHTHTHADTHQHTNSQHDNENKDIREEVHPITPHILSPLQRHNKKYPYPE